MVTMCVSKKRLSRRTSIFVFCEGNRDTAIFFTCQGSYWLKRDITCVCADSNEQWVDVTVHRWSVVYLSQIIVLCVILLSGINWK